MDKNNEKGVYNIACVIVTYNRKELLKKCLEIIKDIRKELDNDTPVDLMELNIKLLWETLGEITGNVYKDELLDEIFSKFCLGK